MKLSPSGRDRFENLREGSVKEARTGAADRNEKRSNEDGIVESVADWTERMRKNNGGKDA